MEIKFYLNKFLKVDNIENYTLSALKSLKDYYDNFIEKTKGTDPDFPLINFGGQGQSLTKGKHKISNSEDGPVLSSEQLAEREKFNSSFSASRTTGVSFDDL